MINCFLVREDDGFTLVDTGLAGSAPGIRDAAQRMGVPICRIVLTHAHIDHLGSLDALAREYPRTTVTALALFRPFFLGVTRRATWPTWMSAMVH